MNTIKLILSIALALLLLPACGTSNGDHDNHGDEDELITHPLGTATSDGGHFTVTITHDPIAPTTGTNTLVLTLESTTHGVEGLGVAVEPWMPGHGHGSNATPEVSDDGAGVYRVTNVVYSMPGIWQARITIDGITIDGDDASDGIVFEYQVQ